MAQLRPAKAGAGAWPELRNITFIFLCERVSGSKNSEFDCKGVSIFK